MAALSTLIVSHVLFIISDGSYGIERDVFSMGRRTAGTVGGSGDGNNAV